MTSLTRFRFTNKLIAVLPPQQPHSRSTDAEYSDTELSGLKCLVSKGEGKKKFLLRYLYNGRKRAIALGHYPELDVSSARALASEFKRQIAHGVDPKQQRQEKRNALTLSEAFYECYLPWAQHHKRSWNKDAQRFRDHIAPVLGGQLVNDIPAATITTLQQSLAQCCKPATNNRIIALLKAIYTWCNRQGITAQHPAKLIPLLRENNARQRYFSEDEIRRIFISADKDLNPVAARYIKLLLLTGLRRDELRLTRWEHVNTQQKTLWLPETKNGYGRIVHLNTFAIELINTLPRRTGNPWLFIGKLEGKPLGNATKAFRRILLGASIFDRDICLHTCRHSVAALIVSHGGTLYDVQAQLGHRSSQSSQRYAHIHPQRLRHTSQLLAESIQQNLPSTLF